MLTLLIRMRTCIDNRGGKSLEACFKGNLICNIADRDVNPHANPRASVPVALLRLATAHNAKLQADNAIVKPALSGNQLDSFIDTAVPPGMFVNLGDSDVSLHPPHYPERFS